MKLLTPMIYQRTHCKGTTVKRFLYLICILSFTTACNPNMDTESGIFPIDSMTYILTDMQMIEGEYKNILIRLDTNRYEKELRKKMNDSLAHLRDSAYSNLIASYQFLFKKYHIDSIKFNHSLRHYAGTPALIDTIYTRALVILENRKKQLEKIDSLKEKK